MGNIPNERRQDAVGKRARPVSSARLPDTTQLVSAVTLAALAAVVLFVTLMLVGRPQGYSARLAAARTTAVRISNLEKAAPSTAAFPDRAVCNQMTSAAADTLRRSLASAASSATVSISNVVLTAGGGDEGAGGLAPVTLKFEASGQYDAVLGLLAQMGRWRPELFVDSMDLRSQVSSVALKLEGRVYCSTSARR